MLTRLHLHDFKSFVDEDVRLGPLCVLLGSNAAGKSNLLDALRFLQGAARGMSIADVLRGRWEGGRQVWPGVRGGIQDAARRGTAQFYIESTWKLGDEDITHLRPTASAPAHTNGAVREIATRVLRDSLTRSPAELRADIAAALETVERIQASPRLNPETLKSPAGAA